MTRIGKVRSYTNSAPLDVPCFKLVVENGRVTLGCWRFSHWEGSLLCVRAVFERIS